MQSLDTPTRRAFTTQPCTRSLTNFTSVYSMSQADAKTLKATIVKYISQCEGMLADSPDEMIVAVNLDFFEA